MRVQLLCWTVALGRLRTKPELHAVVESQQQTASTKKFYCPLHSCTLSQEQSLFQPKTTQLDEGFAQDLLLLTEAEPFGMRGSCSCVSCTFCMSVAAELGCIPFFML